MKGKFLKSTIVAILCVVIFNGNIICHADDSINIMSIQPEVSPCYVAIANTACSLRLGNGGLMTCEGTTSVWNGYKAGLIVELQRNNGDWETIKSWSHTAWDSVDISQNWYVVHGYDYRVQTTHYSYDSAGNLLEVVIKHTKTVYY